LEEIENRRSIRKYLDKKVSIETINILLESGILAPSGNNTQPWHYIIVDDEKIKDEIVLVSNNQKWMKTAPIFLVCIADLSVRNSDESIELTEYSSLPDLKLIIRDSAIAIEHIVLEAVHHSLGTCWVAWFEQEKIRPILGIPSNKYVTCVLTIGYPDQTPQKRKRKLKEEVVHFNKW
jgi:nitroreductase